MDPYDTKEYYRMITFEEALEYSLIKWRFFKDNLSANTRDLKLAHPDMENLEAECGLCQLDTELGYELVGLGVKKNTCVGCPIVQQFGCNCYQDIHPFQDHLKTLRENNLSLVAVEEIRKETSNQIYDALMKIKSNYYQYDSIGTEWDEWIESIQNRDHYGTHD